MIIKVVNLTRALYFKCSETITIPLCKDQTEIEFLSFACSCQFKTVVNI